ncbi:hypothetical protein PUNSTDRAFT_136498 [Punctularia strigosozonata HHB-11173 SS5]|uniref:uncharacterized protein n=1 Tax=Punctularia strigosozonata (strain HHB-11173) TaxID=741275 RepID=UPI0004416F4F|nr:uncharacterized protein PUNSTDRAFT_136498 [Punctularia strigosozonata HHB-11173 SS5]EIN06651.1 hypothetical protein PUNSTDRAFT_136498 [Punctularia strigosozonata HHB-11173 SS5]
MWLPHASESAPPLASFEIYVRRALAHLRLRLYLALSRPAGEPPFSLASGVAASTNYLAPVQTDANVRYFRFGIPLVLKRTPRGVSTEADALRFLNARLPDLPIPRLLDVVTVSEPVVYPSDRPIEDVIDGDETEDGGDPEPATRTFTYTLLTRLPGVRMSELMDASPDALTDADTARIVRDVRGVIDRLWSLSPDRSPAPHSEAGTSASSGHIIGLPPTGPHDDGGHVHAVMLSASGHGLPDPLKFHAAAEESLAGPFPSTLACYAYMAGTSDPAALPDLLAHPPTYRPAPSPPNCTTTKPAETADDLAPEAALAVLAADPVVWVHTDLRLQNILVRRDPSSGGAWRLSGIVDWQDSGWLPRHWQLHVLRRPHWGCRGAWLRIWLGAGWIESGVEADSEVESDTSVAAIGRFDEATERAYEVSKRLLVYPL